MEFDTTSEMARGIIARFAEWESKARHGRGYHGSQRRIGRGDYAIWYEAYEAGFRFLKSDRWAEASQDDWAGLGIDTLDVVLIEMGSADIPVDTRALLAGSVLRYMAELD